MQNDTATTGKASGSKRRNRKDYLYKVGKLKQNRILCDNADNEAEYTQQPTKQASKQIDQQLQQDLDFELFLPAPNTSVTTPITTVDLNQFHSKNLMQSDSLQNNNTVRKIEISSQNQHKQEQNPNKSRERNQQQRQILANHRPITFDDFDEEAPTQQHNERVITTNNEIVDDKIVKLKQGEEQSQSSSCSQQEIRGVSITSNSLQGNVVIKITNKKQLVLSRLPPGIILKCIIRRSSDIFNPEFDFYLNNGLKHMMSAKKYSLAKKEIFKISLQLGRYQNRDIIGSIMANTLHNTYWIYKQVIVKDHIEYEIKGTIKYEKMIKNKERQMIVELEVDKNKEIRIEPQRLAHTLLENPDLKLKNSEFKAKQSSSKNYQLYDEEDKDYQYLKMNKVSDHMFEVEIQHPLSPLQAFAISLTRFDAELK